MKKLMGRHSRRLAILLVAAASAVTGYVRSQEAKPELTLGGSLNAPIRIEVFSDFQCPACRTLYVDSVRQVLQNYCTGDKVCVIYHEFPLAMHPYAREAARWALASQRLGRKQYNAVVDALYQNQVQWSLDGKVEAAIMGAVTPEEFQKMKRMLQEPWVEDAIMRDIALGQKRQVTSTPTLFVNAAGQREQRVEGPVEYKLLKAYFDRVVK